MELYYLHLFSNAWYLFEYIAGVQGTVKYVGTVSFAKGPHLGVELDTPGNVLSTKYMYIYALHALHGLISVDIHLIEFCKAL